MKSKDNIPSSKVSRAMRFAKAGVQVGGNYVKHYSQRLAGRKLEKDDLHRANAEDVYGALGDLKGSVLKLAQMLSMDKGMLPAAYADKFQLARYSAPPLSGPLVQKICKQELGQSPQDFFDRFESEAVAAASIGQVHRAEKAGNTLAIKIQYPGVRDSIESDIRLAKPVALRMLNMKEKDIKPYLEELTAKLQEETDYNLELEQGIQISEGCKPLENVHFPTYYREWSSEKILVMDWIDGMHLDQFIKSNPSQEARNAIGQAIWDFYNFQVHDLRIVHADPHPGNFLIDKDNRLWVIDFGCVKDLPERFYNNYFRLLHPDILNSQAAFAESLEALDILLASDDEKARSIITANMIEMIELMTRPMRMDSFYFGDTEYFEAVYKLGDRLSRDSEFKKLGSARGPKDAMYINRTYFGLYSLLNQLNATISTAMPESFQLPQKAA